MHPRSCCEHEHDGIGLLLAGRVAPPIGQLGQPIVYLPFRAPHATADSGMAPTRLRSWKNILQQEETN